MKFAYAGAPAFAAWALEHLVGMGRRPVLVISQPDRPVGRGRKAAAPPAAATAARLGLELMQPSDINAPEVLQAMRAAGAEVLVVAAFGQILRATLLDSILCINVHGSLLPSYRGAAPIERAVAAGEERIGVIIMRITVPLDSGPWALQKSVSVSLRDDAGSVANTLAYLGAQGIDQVLTGLGDGTVVWTEQEGGEVPVYAEKICSEDCLLDVARPARAVHDHVRSLSPRLGVRVASGGLLFKVWRTWPYGQAGLLPVPPEAAAVAGQPGLMATACSRMFVGCSEGAVEVLSVQPDGKGRMTAAEFLRGYGGRLGGTMDRPLDTRGGRGCR